MRFLLKDSNIFKIPNNPHMLHIGTIGYNMREFIVMLCVSGVHQGKMYIEEVVLTSVDFKEDVFANLKFIEDDNLANDLAAFAEEKGLRNPEKILEVLSSASNLVQIM